MEPVKLYDSELKLMELLWAHEPVSAKQLAVLAAEVVGWNKNTTYTVVKKLVEKKAVLRCEPNFVCTSLIKKEEIAKQETETLIEKLYNGSKKAFFAAFLEDTHLSREEIEQLKDMIERR